MPNRPTSARQTHSDLARRHIGDMTVVVNFVSCACCDRTIEKVARSGKPYPMEAWKKFAEREGWSVVPRKEKFFCREHSK